VAGGVVESGRVAGVGHFCGRVAVCRWVPPAVSWATSCSCGIGGRM